MKQKLVYLFLAVGLGILLTGQMTAATLQITFTNSAPFRHSLWLMRPWIALHDGGLQTFTIGQPASSGIQHIAEDGVTGDTSNPSLLSGPPNVCAGDPSVYNGSAPCENEIFSQYGGGSQQLTIGGPTIRGGTLIGKFTVNPNDPKSQYLSYVVMMVPSNDAFFGTDSAHPIRLYDENGHFNGGRGPIRIRVTRGDILDAGTEVNTENSTDTAFLGQTINGTGIHPDTDPVVHLHPGFGNDIMNGFNIFPGSQINFFNRANAAADVAYITISEVP